MSSPDADVEPRVAVLGVRHHGPGSARSVLAALDELAPDVLVIEGAPELDALVPWAAEPGLVPPVAALVYAVDSPRRSAFYPLAVYSPEWVALRWAVARGVAVRFADLPAVHSLAPEPDTDDAVVDATRHRPDAIGTLAAVAGYDDAERWWEDAVEHRSTSTLETFALIAEAMAEVRAEPDEEDPEILLREAAMRRVVRAVLKDGAQRVAVVCGAYHAPVLHPSTYPAASRDTKLLAGLPRTKVATTWAPWTASRLSVASGYGAGVTAPGWYQHLFVTWAAQDAHREAADGSPPPDVVSGWLTRVARALREEDLDAAPATVVEAARMAQALAAVRARPSVGLTELDDAVATVLCEGSELPLELVRRKVVIGEALGEVPDSVPLTPLAHDLARLQRRLRLKPSASATTVVLDLRKEPQRERSVFLHRLRLLGVPWGTETDAPGARRSTGTFKEAWELVWEPELTVAVVEAALHGPTVLDAAEARAVERATEAPDLAALSTLVGACLTAELPRGLAAVVDVLAERTARQHDVRTLLEAVEPLARTRRYGDVRGADTQRVAGVLDTVVARASIGLRGACAALDDDAAAAMRAAVDGAHRGLALLHDVASSTRWHDALASVAADAQVHGLVSGRVNRLLLDAGLLDADEAGRRLSRRLSPGGEATAAAAWLDGFLEGDALLLVHDAALLALVDDWVARIDDDTFDDLLPLLRRTFSRFAAAERRQVAHRLRHPDEPVTDAAHAVDLDRGLPVAWRVAALLGAEVPA